MSDTNPSGQSSAATSDSESNAYADSRSNATIVSPGQVKQKKIRKFVQTRQYEVKIRAPLRTKVTRCFRDYTEFMEDNPDTDSYNMFQHGNLASFQNRVGPLLTTIAASDAIIRGTYPGDLFKSDDLEQEEAEIYRYMIMLGNMDSSIKLVTQARETDLQIKLNVSMAGVHVPLVTPLGSSTPHPGNSGVEFFGTPASTVVVPRYSGVKCPDIKLPTFSGDCATWPSFYDRFMGMIDRDPRFSPCHKLEYLKSSCTGEASRILTPLQSTDKNYQLALQLLKNRFEDEWPTIATHLDAIFHFKPLHSKSGKDLRRLHEVFTQNVLSLLNLGHTVDGIVLVYLMGTKLDPESRELWEREVVVLPKDKSSGKSKMPTSDQLLRFVQYRAKTLEHAPSWSNKGVAHGVATKKNVVATAEAFGDYTGPGAFALATDAKGGGVPPRRNRVPWSKNPVSSAPCFHCGKTDHLIWACQGFKSATMDHKKHTLTKNKL